MTKALTLYRAGDSEILTGATSFAEDITSARAYLANPGYGGRTIYRTRVEIDDAVMLDVRDEDDAAQIAAILAAAGMADHYGAVTADFLLAREEVIDALVSAGYRWVRLLDTYPVGAETYTWLYAGAEPELEEVE